MNDLSWRFIIGILLMVTNQPVGWGGIVYFTYLGKKTGKKIYYGIGTTLYALSWLMLCTGLLMTGPDGIVFARVLTNKYEMQSYILSTLLAVCGITIFLWRKRAKKTSESIEASSQD